MYLVTVPSPGSHKALWYDSACSVPGGRAILKCTGERVIGYLCRSEQDSLAHNSASSAVPSSVYCSPSLLASHWLHSFLEDMPCGQLSDLCSLPTAQRGLGSKRTVFIWYCLFKSVFIRFPVEREIPSVSSCVPTRSPVGGAFGECCCTFTGWCRVGGSGSLGIELDVLWTCPTSCSSSCWGLEGPWAHRSPRKPGMLGMQGCPFKEKDV